MLNQQTLEKLRALRLHVMVEAFRAQAEQAGIHELSFNRGRPFDSEDRLPHADLFTINLDALQPTKADLYDSVLTSIGRSLIYIRRLKGVARHFPVRRL